MMIRNLGRIHHFCLLYTSLLYKIRDAGLPSNRALRLRQAEKDSSSKDGDSTTGAAAD